jgi:hypothetical protein
MREGLYRNDVSCPFSVPPAITAFDADAGRGYFDDDDRSSPPRGTIITASAPSICGTTILEPDGLVE